MTAAFGFIVRVNPTIEEKGYPNAALDLWCGLFVPKGTSKLIVEKLTRAMKKTLNNPVVIKNFESTGTIVDYMEGEGFVKFMDEERKILENIITNAKISL